MTVYPFQLTTQVGSVNLNDGAKYQVIDFDFGTTEEEEAWIESFYIVAPILSQSQARKTKMSIAVKVFGRTTVGGALSHSQLQQNVEDVRTEFYKPNVVTWSFDGGTTQHQVQTFKSYLEPVPIAGDMGVIIMRDHVIPIWRFEVTRHPFELNQQAPLVI